MIYKNLSYTTKTFYGVSFKPGEVHEVDGYINHPDIVAATESDLNKCNISGSTKKPEPIKKSEPVKKSATSTKPIMKEEVKSSGSDNN